MNKANKVRELLVACLYTDEECAELEEGQVPDNALKVEGIVNNFAFHPERVEQRKEEIRDLLNEMPDEFHVDKGGGMSFLKMCNDKHGEHWAEHRTMGELIALGAAADMAKYCLPRELWSSLPGGVPYVVFNT